MAKRDYYDILGVSKSAAADEIKKAHRKLVRQYHPDVNSNNAAASEKFKEVQEAYDVLSDEQKKKAYDQFGHAAFQPGAPPPGTDPYEAFRRAGQSRQWGAGGGVTVEDIDLEELLGGGRNRQAGGGFGDLFESMFGGKGGRTRTNPAGPTRGPDIEYPVTISFEDAARGRTLPIRIQRGHRTESIDVRIPAGVNTGSRIRLKNLGEQGPAGPGDLYILTNVSPHPYFERDGLEVLLDLPISLYEAISGTSVEVPTLDGLVTIKIPAGTSSGAKLRIKGRGIERGKEKGDQHCLIKIVVPKPVTDDFKEAMEKLAKKHPVDARENVKW